MEFKPEYYYQQGYNYTEYTPDGKTKLGGNCQTAVLVIAMRMASHNTDIGVNEVHRVADSIGQVVLDREYLSRIVYPTISAIMATKFDTKVDLILKDSLEGIKKAQPNNYYWEKSQEYYLNPPNSRNYETTFEVPPQKGVEMMLENIKKGGISIPLVKSSLIPGSDDPFKKDFLHAVIVCDSERQGCVGIIDPCPGFTNEKGFQEGVENMTFKVEPNRMTFEQAQEYAKKYHPHKSVVYDIPIETLEEASIGYITNISQIQV